MSHVIPSISGKRKYYHQYYIILISLSSTLSRFTEETDEDQYTYISHFLGFASVYDGILTVIAQQGMS